jgi:hypothetical protein
MSETAKLSASFHISIPKSVREARKWEVGQTFAFIPKSAGVLLVPVPTLHALKGMADRESRPDPRDRSDRF